MEYLQKIFSGLVSLVKGLFGLISGKGNEEAAKKVASSAFIETGMFTSTGIAHV